MPTYVITGSNSGIGLELTRQLAGRGDAVFALCRKCSDELKAITENVTVIEGIDVAKDDVGEKLAASSLNGVSIDCLINNAGAFTTQAVEDPMQMFALQKFDTIAMDEMRTTFELNTLGPLRVTKALVGQIPEGGQVIIISTMMGSISDNTSGAHYG
jgi:tubulin alpha